MRIFSLAWIVQHRRSSVKTSVHSATALLHCCSSPTATTFALHSPTSAVARHSASMEPHIWHRCAHSTATQPATNEQIAKESRAILETLRSIAEEGLKPQQTLTDSIVEGVTVLPAPVRILVRNVSDARDFRTFDFPLSNASADASALDELKTYCQPASFGRGEEDVLDPTYRSALAIDSERFVTDLLSRPDCDIADRIRTIVCTPDDFQQGKQVVFEPVNFNVYGEGGFFKKHRDTPYAQDHFGSLVVCLPSAFDGGALRIETSPDVHRDIQLTASQSVGEDSSNFLEGTASLNASSTAPLRWLLFPSYLEHEVLPVTRGNRITVTFNVFLRNSIQQHAKSTDPAKDVSELNVFPQSQPSQVLLSGNQNMLSLMDYMQEHKASPSFAPPGTKLGFFCTHLYPLQKKYSQPPILRGTDAALLDFLKSQMGYDVEVVPVVDLRKFNERFEEWVSPKDVKAREERERREQAHLNAVWKGDGEGNLLAGTFDELDWFGKTDHVHEEDDTDEYRYLPTALYESPLKSLGDVVWVNKWVHNNFPFPYTVMGNCVSKECFYAAVGIIATVRN